MTASDPRLYSGPCERNREVIAATLATFVPPGSLVVEVGSGTGQHAAYLSQALPGVTWQPTDRGDGEHESIRAWTAGLENVRAPLEFDLFDDAPPLPHADVVVAINVIHIAPWEATERLFAHAEQMLDEGGFIYLYGPFRYRDRELEPSNERFDEWLQARAPHSAIRTFEDVDAVARAHAFTLVADEPMPANNRSLWWTRDRP